MITYTQNTNKESFSAINSGKNVITCEIEGLQSLMQVIDAKFERIVEHIAGLKGRLIISGMGKSGHIGKKMAATFASTGTPSYFVHPAEASHGDLGMITEQDCLLLLSNSGDTEELRDLVTYAKRFEIYMIAMVRKEPSMLAEAADETFILPSTPEASPVKAPTTSTTMMLALGDALAVAVLEYKGFTPEDFNKFHPGGKLGKAFIRVENLMHPKPNTPLVHKNDLMSKVLLVMTEKAFGCAGVIDEEGNLVGIITDGDLRRHMSTELVHKKASEVMSSNPITVTPDMLAAEALNRMNSNPKSRSITTLFVLEERVPVGIISVHDCLRAGVI